MHWTFLVLLVFLLQLGGLAGAVLLTIVFGSVFLHELGHSLTARHFGIRVLDITFWPLGGMARMSEIPENPRIEGWIAVAGPLVNFALALLGGAVLLFAPAAYQGGDGLFGIAQLDGRLAYPFLLAGWLVEINLTLGLFNLVPAFPMDGGRLLRSFLALKRPWLAATEAAVAVGRQLALATILASVVACPITVVSRGSFPWSLPLIAGFVWFAGGRELWAVRMRELQRRQGTHQSIFDLFRSPRFGGTPGPSVPPGWGEEPEDEPPAAPRRPDVGGAPGARPGGGFTDEEIRELERYPGRLPRRRPDED